MALPCPGGSWGVGCITLETTDTSRSSHLLATDPGRNLFLKMWYPAIDDAARHELVWHSLRNGSRTPAPMRALLRLLRLRTASRSGVEFATAVPDTSVVIYNHGLVSFAEENISLMEALASRGHIVISIEHHAQLVELQALNARQPANERRAAANLAGELARANPTTRATLARRYYEASPNTARIVRERAADSLWVLDQCEALLERIPGLATSKRRASNVHMAGFSLGGAVAVEAALQDRRIRTVVNIDGGTQGTIDATALSAPCLMLYSEGNAGMNDALLPAATVRSVVPGTRHLNFHDIAGLLPALRFTPALGTAHPLAALRERNQGICDFVGAASSGSMSASRSGSNQIITAPAIAPSPMISDTSSS
jgi:dienelactone hydrolase